MVLRPVSYTHLDVYKRQVAENVVIGENAVVGEMPKDGAGSVATIGSGVYIGDGAKVGPAAMIDQNVKAVSYTHLESVGGRRAGKRKARRNRKCSRHRWHGGGSGGESDKPRQKRYLRAGAAQTRCV